MQNVFRQIYHSGKTNLRHLLKSEQDSICCCLNPHHMLESTISHEVSDSVKIIDQILARALARIIVEEDRIEASLLLQLQITNHSEYINYLFCNILAESRNTVKHSIITSHLSYLSWTTQYLFHQVNGQTGTQKGRREEQITFVVTSPPKSHSFTQSPNIALNE